jgi:putative heme-binding domain-containing protein
MMTIALILSALIPAAFNDPAADLGLRVSPGFRVTVYSDQALADDIYAMTLDSRGRVVVTSQGYVTRLHDAKGTGKADRAELLMKTTTGGMGLCFDGDDLLFCGDGWLSRYRAIPGTDRLDPAPERLVPLKFGEHGGHAMRKGPDGSWFVIGGNDAGIGPNLASTERSPVKIPEAGAVLRLTSRLKGIEVFAHGFRNPYDFDFNALGDIFTYDSDCERDVFLPWYAPTRLYHVARGGHHGWRLNGYLRSWPRPGDSPDAVDVLQPIGRGSPTGVVCYRHTQFPERYRGGLFYLDWTFGRVYFSPLTPEGTTYQAPPEVFIEPTGSHGFAPNDAVIAPDGSLLISIGGRKTRGAVYRVEYVGTDPAKPMGPIAPAVSAAADSLSAVLRAPQPLDSWSRARWVPLARELGAAAFATAIRDDARTAAERIRAVEVATELFGGLAKGDAEVAARSASAVVRARVAWSLGSSADPAVDSILRALSLDNDARVRLATLEAFAERARAADPVAAREAGAASLDFGDKRVRQAAARLAADLPADQWKLLMEDRPKRRPQARLTLALAGAWRGDAPDPLIEEALTALAATTEPNLRFQAIRQIILALGDYRLSDPPVEAFTGYSLAGPARRPDALIARIRSAVREILPTDEFRCDEEASRLLAMLEDDDPSLPAKVAAFWTETHSATSDLHYLIVLARLRSPRPAGLASKVATTLFNLDRKLGGLEQRSKQVWNERLAEIVAALIARDPSQADEILSRPEFIQTAHVSWTSAFDRERRLKSARLFLERSKKDPAFEGSPEWVSLLATLPGPEVRPVLRIRWHEIALRDAIVTTLAQPPEAADRDYFLAGLESAQSQVVRLCLQALEQLPRDEDPNHMVPLLRLLNRLLSEPGEKSLRRAVVSLFARQSGEPAFVREEGVDLPSLRRAYGPMFDEFTQRHRDLAAALNGDDEDFDAWKTALGAVDWTTGDAARGEVVFRAKSCQTCHAGPSRIGPDLAGVANRLSRDDLLAAIVAPSRDVAPPYRVTTVETREGRLISGVVAFESADGLIIQTGSEGTVRVATPDIAVRASSQRSLMPSGLLKGLSPRDVTDLYEYLRTTSSAVNVK